MVRSMRQPAVSLKRPSAGPLLGSISLGEDNLRRSLARDVFEPKPAHGLQFGQGGVSQAVRRDEFQPELRSGYPCDASFERHATTQVNQMNRARNKL